MKASHHAPRPKAFTKGRDLPPEQATKVKGGYVVKMENVIIAQYNTFK